MKKLTIRELANATGQTEGTVRKHIEREKVKKSRDGTINADTDFNKAYINAVTKGAGLFGAIVKEVIVDGKKTVLEKPERALSASAQINQDLELRKRRADTDLKERESEIKRIQLEKQAGNLLPIDMVEKVMIINFQSVFKNLDSELENIASIYTQRFGGTRKDVAEIVVLSRGVLAKAIEQAKKEANHEIENVIKEMQSSLGK